MGRWEPPSAGRCTGNRWSSAREREGVPGCTPAGGALTRICEAVVQDMTTESPVAPLDRYQQQAATAPIGPVLILGGAGTGKTHTLAARIAIAVKGGEGLFSITCLTHSTGGGYAIQERVKGFLPEHDSPGWFFAGTPQEFAMALLRSKGAQVLGMSPHFTVWPRSGAQEFIAFLLGANPRNRKRLHAEAGRILDWLWLNLAGYPDEPTPPDRPEWRGAVEKYQEELRRQNAVDRGVVVPMVNRALESDLEFRNTVRLERCRYLLVDDYQNITPAEYTMLRSLTIAVNPNECVRLRDGADDRLLEICRLDHPGMHQNTYSLRVDHRATPPLLEAKTRISNDPVLRHLQGEDNVTPRSAVRFGERWATPPPPALLEFEGRPTDMYKYIFDGTQEFLPQGYAFEDIAVVFQDASILDQMRPLALSRGIPFTVLGVERQPRDRDVRCITGLLRSLLNPHDSAAFRNAACANPHLDRQWPGCGGHAAPAGHGPGPAYQPGPGRETTMRQSPDGCRYPAGPAVLCRRLGAPGPHDAGPVHPGG